MRRIFMIKKVWKPFWSYDVLKTETWLSFMANKGYFLIDINRRTRIFSFQYGEPQRMTYRIAYDKGKSDSLASGLVEEGWSLVFHRGHWTVTTNEKRLEQ